MNTVNPLRPIGIQYKLMPIVSLVTYSCGHYSQKRTDRTDARLQSLPNANLFPIDEVDHRNEPCGLDQCAHMSENGLYTALFPMINHAFDILTRLENEYQDHGHRFYLLRQPTLSSVARHPHANLLEMLRLAFDADTFPERSPPRSFLQILIDNTEQRLLHSRHSLYSDPAVALSELNNSRVSLCELSCDMITIDRTLAWLEDIQWGKEDNEEIEDETIEDEYAHLRRATDWAHSLPEAQQAMANHSMRSGCVVRTMFQPDRFLAEGEHRPQHPMSEVDGGNGLHTDLSWNIPGSLLIALPRDCQTYNTANQQLTLVDDPSLMDPDLTAVPSDSDHRVGISANDFNEVNSGQVTSSGNGASLPQLNWTELEARYDPRARPQDELFLPGIGESSAAESDEAFWSRLRQALLTPDSEPEVISDGTQAHLTFHERNAVQPDDESPMEFQLPEHAAPENFSQGNIDTTQWSNDRRPPSFGLR